MNPSAALLALTTALRGGEGVRVSGLGITMTVTTITTPTAGTG